MGMEGPGHTLETSALVHEAYIKLVGLDRMEWRGRSHFFAAAAGAMRRILIDHATSRKALKRGGTMARVALDDVDLPAHHALDDESLGDILALDQALDRLRELDERQARVVEARFFAGMSIEEVAEALDVSPMTVKRDWTAARAWLNRELSA